MVFLLRPLLLLGKISHLLCFPIEFVLHSSSDMILFIVHGYRSTLDCFSIQMRHVCCLKKTRLGFERLRVRSGKLTEIQAASPTDTSKWPDAMS